ncbi:DUF185-domain-containing protein, partial [Wilcoxina mikolae CBS 423.85]
RTFSTPLAKHLTEAIKTTGPISLAAYMRQCLTSEHGGYYTSAADPFGRSGDFITSPEISQLFGEMVGIWVVSEWMAQGRKSNIHLIELGPGRGTLMDDVLRTLTNFRSLASAISSIFLVEASASLRAVQAQLLCGSDTTTPLSDGGFTAKSKPEYNSIPITWYPTLSSVPKASTPFILAHEFFDALPIHVFEATSSGWRELLVSPAVDAIPPAPEFLLSRSPAATPHSMVLPELSERYKELKKSPGAIIEVSPESLSITEEISRRIGNHRSGAALIMDYGPLDHIPVNSLRGIRRHRTVSPFVNPGEVDLSADVDFVTLAERALVASEGVEVHGPVEQGSFLLTMGMKERLEQLVKRLPEERRKELEVGVERLVERGGGGMGRVYKAMAIVPERGGRRPVGFGGGV